MQSDSAVRVENLCRSFGDVRAVDGISFEIEHGEIFSLLGPNGAGKTTTISMIDCLLKPDKGDVYVMGYSVLTEPQMLKEHLGVVPQEVALYEDLSARENLEFWGRMEGLSGKVLKQRVDEVLALIGLTERQKERISKYSGGMKRRVNLGVALLHKPDLLIMDEPTVGIDPQSRRHILDGVKEFNREGMTILYTTHYMEEAQELSDHIAIMDQGKIIAMGTHSELVKIVGEKDRIDMKVNQMSEALLDQWREIDGVEKVTALDGTITALVDNSNRVLPRFFEVAAAMKVYITFVEIREPNLETVFLHLTGKALRD